MSYSPEQRENHMAYVEKEMANYTQAQRAEVIQSLVYTWPTDDELKAAVEAKKAEIAKEATPEEMEQLLTNFRM